MSKILRGRIAKVNRKKVVNVGRPKKTRKTKAIAPKAEAIITIRSKSLGQAPEEKTFVLKGGRKLASLYELIDELETMNDDLFNQHVDDMKNDFASWIRDVFENRPLADEIHKMHDRFDTQRAILKHIVRDLKQLERK